MARKAPAGANGAQSTRVRRGGRKPGTWTLVTPEQIRAYRDGHRVSRVRMAQMLGCSPTSVQNWEKGKVATTKTQLQIKELIETAPSVPLPSRQRQGPSLLGAREAGEGVSLEVTGRIVTAYVAGAKALGTEELVGLIRGVRAALS